MFSKFRLNFVKFLINLPKSDQFLPKKYLLEDAVASPTSTVPNTSVRTAHRSVCDFYLQAILLIRRYETRSKLEG